MSKNLFEALAYEVESREEIEIFDCKEFNDSSSYKIITLTNIAEQLLEKPDESVVFSLYYDLDKDGNIIENENYGVDKLII